jgi:hypothetical protein
MRYLGIEQIGNSPIEPLACLIECFAEPEKTGPKGIMDKGYKPDEGEREQTTPQRSLWSTCFHFFVLVAVIMAVAAVVVGSYMAVRIQPRIIDPRAREDARPAADPDKGLSDIQYRLAPATGWTYSNRVYTTTGTNPVRVSISPGVH